MNRRDFITTLSLGAGLFSITACRAGGQASVPQVMTVRGMAVAGDLGMTLPHEHVLVDFSPFNELDPAAYDPDEVVSVALPYLEQAYAFGCRTIVECTPAYLGRDPRVLRLLSDASGLHLITNTGYYAARNDQHLPPHAFTDSVDELASRWIGEWVDGIAGSGIRPGFMKLGFDGGALSTVERKLIRAAALTHQETGLTIGSHTGPAVSAFEQLSILQEEYVHPSAWIWIHAQAEPDVDQHVAAARRGAWLSFDGIGPETAADHLRLVLHMREAGFLNQVLISHDAGWYSVGEPNGGSFRGFDTIFSTFIPALIENGLSDTEIKTLTVDNPARALSVGTRSADPT